MSNEIENFGDEENLNQYQEDVEFDESETEEDQEDEIQDEASEDEETGEETEDEELLADEDESPEDELILDDPVDEAKDDDNNVIKTIRQRNKELNRQLKEQQAKLAQLEANPVNAPQGLIQVSEQPPNLEDYDYDTAEFHKAYETWQQARQHNANYLNELQNKQVEVQMKQRELLNNYEIKKREMNKPDYAEIEQDLATTFTPEQQRAALSVAEEPAKVVYYLGKNPGVVDRLSSITDPVKFAAEIAKFETRLLSQLGSKKMPKPQPEKRAPSGSSNQRGSTNKLNALKAKAEKSGDYTAYFAYKKSMKK